MCSLDIITSLEQLLYRFFFKLVCKQVSSILHSVSMSSLCLSSVLTCANLAMYQTGISDVLPQQPSINTLQIGNPGYSSNVSGKTLWCSLSLL